MISSSAALAADDVSIRCRVRRSDTVSEPDFDNYVDMTCILRNWENTKHRRRSSFVSLEKTLSSVSNPSKKTMGMISDNNGPELLLQPAHQRSSDPGLPNFVREQQQKSFGGKRVKPNYSRSRSSSNGRRRIWNEVYANTTITDDREQNEEKEVEPYAIPVYDVVVVDSKGCRNYTAASIYLTTTSMGYFEFSFPTANAHDIFMAFLTNTLPFDRIAEVSSTQSFCNPAVSFDVEALTAKSMQQRVQEETLSEKMRRKMVFVAHRIGELSYTISEACACGCDVPDSPKVNADNEGRQSPPRTFEFPTELEVETSSATERSHFSPR